LPFFVVVWCYTMIMPHSVAPLSRDLYGKIAGESDE
jgi:hypothetical protein